jgi:hypothetical protein
LSGGLLSLLLRLPLRRLYHYRLTIYPALHIGSFIFVAFSDFADLHAESDSLNGGGVHRDPRCLHLALDGLHLCCFLHSAHLHVGRCPEELLVRLYGRVIGSSLVRRRHCWHLNHRPWVGMRRWLYSHSSGSEYGIGGDHSR